jgi:hypothetical protein
MAARFAPVPQPMLQTPTLTRRMERLVLGFLLRVEGVMLCLKLLMLELVLGIELIMVCGMVVFVVVREGRNREAHRGERSDN